MTTRALVIVHLPAANLAGLSGNLRKICELDQMPAPEDVMTLPGGLTSRIQRVEEIGEGRTHIHLDAPALARALTTDGSDLVEAVRELHEDLRASGFSPISEWDTEGWDA
jgi:hypothetical protein